MSIEKRLYEIMKDGYFHDSYSLSNTLWPHEHRLANLHARFTDLRNRGCTFDTMTELEYHKYLLFDERVTTKLIGELPKRFWYKMVWTPAGDIFSLPIKKYARKDTTELVTVFSDEAKTRVCLI